MTGTSSAEEGVPRREFMAVDDLAVVHASARAAAADHGRVQALDAASRADLMSFLRELDGSDDPTPVPEPAGALAGLAAVAGLLARQRARVQTTR